MIFNTSKSIFSRKNGFTLLELLIVISIIALLASIALVALRGAKGRANMGKFREEMHQLKTALTLYANDNGGKYPGDSCGNIPSGFSPTYMDISSWEFTCGVNRPQTFPCPGAQWDWNNFSTALGGAGTSGVFIEFYDQLAGYMLCIAPDPQTGVCRTTPLPDVMTQGPSSC